MTDSLSTREIDSLVANGGKLLRAISIKPEIMQLMLGLGYSETEHKAGWELYLRMLGYLGAGANPVAISSSSTAQVQALTELDRFDEPAFKRATAALGRLHLDQLQYIFGDGLSAKSGPEAVGTVQTFLDRYAALRDGTDPNRVDKRDADAAAAKTLEERNIVNREIERVLRERIETIKKPAPAPVVVQNSAPEEALQRAAAEFSNWLKDWRTTAQAGIHRRDYRIMLGVAKRRSTVDSDDGTDEVTTTSASAE